MKTSLAIILTIFALSNALKLPQTLKPCRRSNPEYSECLNNLLTTFVPSLAHGDKSLNMPSIDPLAIDKIKIGASRSTAASLTQKYKNVLFYGISKGLRVSNARFDLDKLFFYSETRSTQLDFVADYELDGRILILPIRGAGRSNITMMNQSATNSVKFEKFIQDGETYLRVTKYEVKFHPEKVLLRFDNLFDGNAALAKPMNALLSESADLIFSELKGSYEEAFGQVFAEIANKILTRFPMKILFPE